MSKLIAFSKSFYKNVIIMHKFRAFFLILVDSDFRRDLNRLYELKSTCTRVERRSIPVECIRHGHKVVYPAYALSLFAAAKDLPAIRVVFDPAKKAYVVVDGNHRLPALIAYARHSNYQYVECEVMS